MIRRPTDRSAIRPSRERGRWVVENEGLEDRNGRWGRNLVEEVDGRLRQSNARDKGVGAMTEHNAGERIDKWKGLRVEIPEDGIRAPATDQLNDVVVNTTTKECHSTAGARAAGTNVGRSEA